jgi:outer membrane protein assembly factor BamB
MKYMIKIFLGLFASALLMGCASTKKMAPVPQSQSSLTIHRVWTHHINQGKYTHFAPQLVGDQIIDAGSTTIKVIDAQTGVTHNTIKTKQQIVSGIGTNGSLFIVASLKGGLYAYDENGKVLWETQTSSEAVAPAAITNNGRVIVRTIDGRVTSYTQENGKQQWQFVRPIPPLSLRNYAPVTAIGGLIFAGLANGQIVGLIEENGDIAWEAHVAIPRGATELERAVDVLSRPIVIDQQVCAVAYQGRIACFAGANGALIWAREMSSVSDLTTDGRLLFGVTEKGEILAFDNTNGATVWQLNTLNGRELGAPVVFGRHLVFGDIEGYVYFLNKDSGEIEAIERIGKASIRQQPIVFKENVIIKTTKGDLVALRV